MSKFPILFFTTFLFLNTEVISQISQEPDTILTIENAKYLNGDITKLLQSELKYPIEALKNSIEGDVIISFIINKHGKLEDLTILESPDIILSTCSLVSFDKIKNEWNPCKINGNSINKKYLLVFRYRIYLNTEPPEYKKKAGKFVDNQKYERALKYYNKAIKENSFDFELFESRSKIKELLEDTIGAKQDSIESVKIKNEIITFIDMAAIGITRKVEKSVRY